MERITPPDLSATCKDATVLYTERPRYPYPSQVGPPWVALAGALEEIPREALHA
jgi:hypothetical protein